MDSGRAGWGAALPRVGKGAEAGIAGTYRPKARWSIYLTPIGSGARAKTLCRPDIVATLSTRLAALASRQNPRGPTQLTSRKLQVLILLERGMSNRRLLSIEAQTIKNRIQSFFERWSGVTAAK